MGSKMHTVLANCFLFLFTLDLNFKDSSATIHPLYCHQDETDALLQFKHSFSLNKSASIQDPFGYPKTASWNVSLRGDGGLGCHCTWDGVQCDPNTGRVMGLDLNGSCLYGTIDSSSSIFNLVHLRRLNLAFNDFNQSQIPAALGRLSRLTHLNLSSSSFSGQIPLQVLELSQLVSLALWGNPSTMLQKPGLESLVQNLTTLQELHLSEVSISSTVPVILANLSNLTSLYLKDCGLHGEFPREIFHLPKLRSLSLRFNPNLTGLLPEFRKGSPLRELKLASTRFYGKIPDSIGNLNSLNWLDISEGSFSGSFPASMANLTQLSQLDLSYNDFQSQILPSWLGELSQLTELYLGATNLKGEIPSSLANLTRLSLLFLETNQLTGQLPFWLTNLTCLAFLDISQNNLRGLIPNSIHQLSSLEWLYLQENNLSGTVELDKFRNVYVINLSNNKLSVLTDTNISNATSRKWKKIWLKSCNLSTFPEFLRGQNELEWLDLSSNNLHGPIPKWFWNTSTKTLKVLGLYSNFLTEIMQPAFFLPWKQLESISLADNRLQGFLPIPPPSTYAYLLQNNSFTGNIPPQLYNLATLYILDVSNNNLSGTIPPCLGSFSDHPAWVNYRGINSHGTIPITFNGGCQLHKIDLSQNQFRGQVPRSLANCTMLEILDISNNQINDVFPCWLGILPSLKILILRSNQFHGTVRGVKNTKEFPKLHIIDLSNNGFFGNLPAKYIQNWNAMKVSNRLNSTYMTIRANDTYMKYSTKLIIKGVERPYIEILDTFMVIDLSCNKFDGSIPMSIADLKGLQSLNLSSNYLTGSIPSTLGNLSELESLDLSHNKLSGQIPVELVQLTFLGRLDISYNNLYGAIPRGRQFDTFPNTSYTGNLRLCGKPLSKQCGNLKSLSLSPAIPEKDTDTKAGFEFDWEVITIGYAGGLVIGVMIGCTLTARRLELFVEAFRKKQH